MRAADVHHGFAGILRKTVSGVGAEETEGFVLAELVPEMFKAYRGANLTFTPQERDHFTECANLPPVFFCPADYIGDHVVEQGFIRPVVDHETGKHVPGVDRNVFGSGHQRFDFMAQALEPVAKTFQMGGGCDDDHGVPFENAVADKPAKKVEKYFVI